MATKGLQYSDVVKAQGGTYTNPQTGAKTYASGSEPKSGNFAVRGSNSELLRDIDPSKATFKDGIPDYSTPTTKPIEPRGPASPAVPTLPITNQQALETAKQSGIPAPQEGGEARSAISQFMPSEGAFYKPKAGEAGYDEKNPDMVYNSQGQGLNYDQFIAQGGKSDFSNVVPGAVPIPPQVTQQVEQDPQFQALLDNYNEIANIQNQHQSLTDEYSQLTKKLGIPALNTELMNMKNVIDGTEDDIRNEVTKAGGFATESQVMALSFARNKQLVKNYNNLLEVKQQAMEILNTMIGLASQDRQFAMSAISQKMQLNQQILDYRDKMKTNAQNTYQKIIDSVGYAGLAQMTGGDPYYTSLVEKTLGLQPGQLAKMASLPGAQPKKDTQVIEAGGRQLLIDAQTGAVIKDLGTAYHPASGGGSGLKEDINADVQAVISRWQELGYLNSGYIGSDRYREEKAKWVRNYAGDVADPAGQFDDLFSYLANINPYTADKSKADYGIK